MAQPARRPTPAEPPLDPSAIERAYRRQRAKRRARLEHIRELRRARVRFWVVLLVLLALTLYISVVIWQQIQRLFGL